MTISFENLEVKFLDYISLVDIENKKMYDLGKITEAKYYLPYFADKFNGKPIILFGDETHPQLDDEYVLKEYGGEYEECFVGNENCNDDILCDINMCRLEFVDIFEKIGGKVITNLNDYIRYKYNNY